MTEDGLFADELSEAFRESEIYASANAYKISKELALHLNQNTREILKKMKMLLSSQTNDKIEPEVHSQLVATLSEYCQEEIKRLTNARRALADDVRKELNLDSLLPLSQDHVLIQ